MDTLAEVLHHGYIAEVRVCVEAGRVYAKGHGGQAGQRGTGVQGTDKSETQTVTVDLASLRRRNARDMETRGSGGDEGQGDQEQSFTQARE